MSHIRTVLNSPDREIFRSKNLLTRLYRSMLLNLNINATMFEHSLNSYLNNPRNPVHNDAKAKTNDKGNLMKEIGGNNMTWDVFNKGLLAIGVSEYELEIIIQYRDINTQEMLFTGHKVRVPDLFKSYPKREEKTPSFQTLLTMDDKYLYASGNAITQLFRQILLDLNVTREKYESYIDNYLRNPYNGVGEDSKQRSNHRSNLLKELNENRMTWNVFNKGLRFLGVIRYEFIIRPKITNSITRTEQITEHKMQNDFGNDVPPEKLEIDPALIRSGFTDETMKDEVPDYNQVL